MKKKLKEVRGETLVEVLVSILIGALSISMLFGAVMASGTMDKATREKDETFYKNLDKAEARTEDPDPTHNPPSGLKVKVENTDSTITAVTAEIPVTFYGGEGALSYALTP